MNYQRILMREKIIWRAILDNLSEGVIVADGNGKFLYFNPVAEKILGIGLKDITSEEWTSVYGCYYPDQVTPYPWDHLPLARAIRGEETPEEMIFIKNQERPQGIYIMISANPLISKEGVPDGGIIIFRDVTSQMSSEKALSVSEEHIKKLAMAVEQTADAVVITNINAVINYVNPAFEEMTGYTRQEILGKTPKLLRSGVQNETFYEKLWKNILSGIPFRDTIVNKKKNGELFWCQQTITPMKDASGKITNFVSVIKDITELKKKHEQDMQLRIARELQQRYYQNQVTVPGFDISGATYPAVETGGDYFDFITTHDGYLWLVVADVCGHGIGSALIMAEIRAFLHAYARMESDPGIVLGWINNELTAHLDDYHFVTMILVRLDKQAGWIDYASAGHIPTYLLDRCGCVRQTLTSTGIPLGYQKDEIYCTTTRILLEPEESLVLISDGIPETFALDESEFGFTRMLDIVRHYQTAPAREIVEHLYRSARDFAQDQPQQDDITAIICKVK